MKRARHPVTCVLKLHAQGKFKLPAGNTVNSATYVNLKEGIGVQVVWNVVGDLTPSRVLRTNAMSDAEVASFQDAWQANCIDVKGCICPVNELRIRLGAR